LDSTLAEAHASLASIRNDYDWDWSGAEREFKRAIELNPSYATAHHWYAYYLSAMGRHDEAIAEAKRALELDPLSIIIGRALGLIFYHAHQNNKAIEECQKTLEIDPNFATTHFALAVAYLQKEMYKEAISEAQKAVDLSGGEPPISIIAVLGYIYSVSGKRNEAKKVLKELLELSKQRYVAPYYISLIFGGLGQKNQAFEWLEKAYEERNYWMCFLKVDPMLDNLRSDPRFKALLKKMNLE